MQWTDDAIILSTRRHGETSVIAELMTRRHGRHFGMVRGGRGKRLRPVMQPGNSVQAHWYARIDESLGTFSIEGTALRGSALLEQASALYALSHLGALLRLLPERDPHEALYETLEVTIMHLHEASVAAALMVRFELALLQELGFGLDLTQCAATGATQELVYVSPKSSRAVSRQAGEPYRERLLALPGFLSLQRIEGLDPSPADLTDGFRLTGYFLRRDAFEPRALMLPEARAQFIRAVLGSEP
jgi:DNA repair protein RecO (recombination protein O)